MISDERLEEIRKHHAEGMSLMDCKVARWSAARGDIHNLADDGLEWTSELLAEVDSLRTQLAASHARVARLEEALRYVGLCCIIADEALSPSTHPENMSVKAENGDT